MTMTQRLTTHLKFSTTLLLALRGTREQSQQHVNLSPTVVSSGWFLLQTSIGKDYVTDGTSYASGCPSAMAVHKMNSTV
jgi:hypothetical protein